MEKGIKDSSVIKATGRSITDWVTTIQNSQKGDLSHREIAEFLSKEHGLTSWWAQEITVLYEKQTGKRVTGQTQSSGFQIGVSKTLPVKRDELWNIIITPKVFALIVSDNINPETIINQKRTSETGIEYKITTWESRSHMRMQWKLPEWHSYSILQVRLAAQKSGRTVLTFHQEKMADESIREDMRLHWKEVLTKLEQTIKERRY